LAQPFLLGGGCKGLVMSVKLKVSALTVKERREARGYGLSLEGYASLRRRLWKRWLLERGEEVIAKKHEEWRKREERGLRVEFARGLQASVLTEGESTRVVLHVERECVALALVGRACELELADLEASPVGFGGLSWLVFVAGLFGVGVAPLVGWWVSVWWLSLVFLVGGVGACGWAVSRYQKACAERKHRVERVRGTWFRSMSEVSSARSQLEHFLLKGTRESVTPCLSERATLAGVVSPRYLELARGELRDSRLLGEGTPRWLLGVSSP